MAAIPVGTDIVSAAGACAGEGGVSAHKTDMEPSLQDTDSIGVSASPVSREAFFSDNDIVPVEPEPAMHFNSTVINVIVVLTFSA
jgi:coenzyme F420-reducing hydrogenase gamma subunit